MNRTFSSAPLLQVAQHDQGLLTERDDMRRVHFHALGGYPPFRLFTVDFGPLAEPELTGSKDDKRCEDWTDLKLSA